MDKIKSLLGTAAEKAGVFFAAAAGKIKTLWGQAAEKTSAALQSAKQKTAPLCKKLGLQISQTAQKLFANKKLAAAVLGAAAVAAAGITLTLLAVNVWSWTDVTVSLPYELYVSCTDAVSDSDEGNEFITDVRLPAGVQPVVSGADAPSGSDVVSAADAVSASDAVMLTLHVKKELTVGAVLDIAGIVLDEAHSVDRPLDEVITGPAVITVYRMKYVTLQADGTVRSIYTDLDTVAQLFEEQMITTDADDRISCALSDSLYTDMVIIINRVDVVEEVRTETVPYKTEERENSSMYKGESETVTEGVNGSKEVTYSLTYVDGILESTAVVGEVVTVEPINEVIEYGTKKRPTTTKKTNSGRYVVSREKVYDCDGSGHGYYIITYSDGTVEYKDF